MVLPAITNKIINYRLVKVKENELDPRIQRYFHLSIDPSTKSAVPKVAITSPR